MNTDRHDRARELRATPAPELLFEGGTVWTGVTGPDGTHGTDGAVRRTDALAVAGGHVVALGDDARRLATAATARIDLDGGTLLPGFGDGHAHPVFGGTESLFAPVRDLPSIEAITKAVGQWAAAHPGEPWVRGEGYDPALTPNGEFDARWLDAVVPDRPVVLRAIDYHTAWVNTRALEIAGITAATPDPADGIIGRRPDGTVSGTLREWGAWRLVYDLLPPLTRTQQVTATRVAAERLAACGIVWVQDAWVEPATLDA